MAKGQWKEWTEEVIQEFFETLARTGNITESCRICNISRSQAFRLRGEDEHFAEVWQDAMDIAGDALEAEARRRGCDGYEEPLHHQGRLTGHKIKKYDTPLLMMLLRGAKPNIYKNRSELSAPDGKPLQVALVRDRVGSKLAGLAGDGED